MSPIAPSRAPHQVRRIGRGRSRRIVLASLESINGLAHAFSLRDSTEDAVLRAAMTGEAPLHLLRQVHGNVVRLADGRSDVGPAESPVLEGDALVTDGRSRALGVRVADCVPILICDPVSRGLSAIHAGWRGTTSGVLSTAVETLISRYGSRAADLQVAIGPAIGPCCFAVGREVIDSLLGHDPGASECIRAMGRGWHIDLIEANRRQAHSAGVPLAQIGSANLCTVCSPDLFWSYRRDRDAAGRMLALIGWVN